MILTGVLSLVIFSVLVVLSIYYKIAYHRWKRTHDFFGVLFILIIVHAILGRGEIVKYPLLSMWFGFWCSAGLAAYVYIRLLYRWIGPQFDYVVSDVKEIGSGITEVYLKPVGASNGALARAVCVYFLRHGCCQ